MTELREGWLDNVRLTDYLRIPALSSSSLKSFRRSPAHHRHQLDNPQPETDALRIGTAIHTAILEPGFMDEYAILEGCHGRYKNGNRCGYTAKVARGKKGFCRRHDPKDGAPSKIPTLSFEEYGRVCGARDAVLTHPTAAGLLLAHDGRIERTGVFLDPSGVWCKFRPDRLVTGRDGVRLCVDLKSTRDAGPKFWKDLVSFGYHHQAAFYRRGLEQLGEPCDASVIVAVESEPPHGVGCYLLDEEDVDRARLIGDGLLTEYARCLDADEWPTYPAGLHTRKLPPWAFDE